MKKFFITEQEINEILAPLGDLPAKCVIGIIDKLRTLKECIEEESKEKSEN